MSEELRFDYEVAEEVSKRLDVLFDGLPEEQVKAALEELIDDYSYAMFGVSVMNELRKVKMPSNGRSSSIQTLAKGRAVLISSYGFNVKSESQCKCGRAFLVLDERTEEEFHKDRV